MAIPGGDTPAPPCKSHGPALVLLNAVDNDPAGLLQILSRSDRIKKGVEADWRTPLTPEPETGHLRGT